MAFIPLALGSYKNITSTTVITTKPAVLTGFYVNSTGGGTVVFRDGGASGTVVTGTITPVIGWHFLPISFPTSLHATVGGTIDITLIFNLTAST